MKNKKTGDSGIAIIQEFENLKLEAYVCPAGILTIGWGHTGADVSKGMAITENQALELLRKDLAIAENAVNRLDVDFSQNQFDALVSLTFNIGAHAFANSTAARLARQNPNHPGIPDAIKLWNKSKGKVLAGLVRRRAKEATLYTSKA